MMVKNQKIEFLVILYVYLNKLICDMVQCLNANRYIIYTQRVYCFSISWRLECCK